jgi:hypothetical protein
VVIQIQGREANDVYPIFFGFLTEVAWVISSIEIMMVKPGVPVIVA